ncbi:MAG: O-antigen ligase family protein [Bacillota bacterium]|nr:O-antigen ligase family protein [Bacillota bacterium]
MKWFTFVFLCLLFFITPFQKGLYFDQDIYPITLISSIIFLIFVINQFIRDEIGSLKKALFVLLLPFCYLISLPVAESPNGAWNSILRWVLYSSFFILLIWTTTVPKIKQLLPLFFQLLGGVLSISMIFMYYGWFSYTSALVGGRFSGVFQYPNTFGMIMAVFYFFSLVNLLEEKINIKRVIGNSSLALIYFTCFLQSESRGMLMFFPVVWLVGLLLLPLKKQLTYILYSLFTIVFSLIAYQSIVKEASIHALYPGLMMLIIMLVLSNVIHYFISRKLAGTSIPLLNKVTLKKGSQFFIPLGIVLIVGLGLLDLVNHGFVYHQLPSALQDRIGSISLSVPQAKERLSFYKDAMTMSKSSPILGFGGGGWASTYREFQSAPYISSKVHDGYLEWMIENGWLGLLIFLSVFIYFFYLLVRSYLKEDHDNMKLAVILSLLSVFLHSSLDFNFSFGTVWIVVFWLFAIGFPNLSEKKQNQPTKINAKINAKVQVKNKQLWPKLILIGFSIVLITGLIQSFRFITAEQMFSQSKATNDLTLKEQLLTKTVARNPYNLNYMIALSNVYFAELKHSFDPDKQRKLEQLLNTTVTKEPKNSTVLMQISNLYEQMGNDQKAFSYYNAALKVDHFNSTLYQESLNVKVKMAIAFKDHKNLAATNSLASSALKDYKMEKYWYGKIDHTKAGEVFNSRHFEITPSTKYYASIAYYLQKDYTDVIKVSHEVKPKDLHYNDLLALRILANEQLGKKDSSNQQNLSKNINIQRNLLN